jgi:hypothetical protein
MQIQSYTNNSGKSFPSFNSVHDSNSAAAAELRKRIAENKFQDPSFAEKMSKAWDSNKPMSAATVYWIHRLTQPEKVASGTINLERVNTLFGRAMQKLKRPAIVLSNGTSSIKIAYAGPSSKYRGQVVVAAPTFGDGFYGRVDQSGNWYKTDSCSEDIEELVKQFAESPEDTAAKHGRLTGKCCFCNRGLTDDRSTEVGYGPVCADSFGLSWG